MSETQGWLEASLARHGAVSGTVHVVRDDDMVLAAHVRIPPPVIAKVERVPYGKGMAGVAQMRGEPVQTCNLQTDTSGTVKPVARMVQANAAIAVPVLREGVVVAIVGYAFAHEGEISAAAVQAMDADCRSVPLPAIEAPGPAQLLGQWRIAYGIAPDGALYEGTLAVESTALGLSLRWKLSTGDRQGLAIWADGAAVAGYGATSDASGSAVYLDLGDGLTGRWAHPSLQGSLGTEVAFADGSVTIWEGAEACFSGSLEVERRRHGCAMTWTGPETYIGVGLRRGSLLGASWWAPGSAVGAMWIEPHPLGLSARWVEAGSDGLGRVLLERIPAT